MAIVSVQCIKLHLIIKQIRKCVAICFSTVYIHFNTYILVKQVNEGVAIVSVHAYTLYLLIKQIREGVAIVSVQCMHTPLIN